MKKIFALFLALILAAAAIADTVPSKTTDDMTTIATDAEGLVMYTKDNSAKAQAQLKALMNTTPEAYFGDSVMDKIEEAVKEGPVEVTEFTALFVENYDESMGDVTAHIEFATPVEEGDKAAVLVGFDNGGDVEWKVFEAECTEDGAVDVVLDGETLERIENEGAYLALAISLAEPAETEVIAVKVPSTTREGVEIPVFITAPADCDPNAVTNVAIMIHGHGGNHNEWGGFDAISEELAKNGVLAVAVDFPGCGDSTESFRLNTMTNMKSDVLDTLNYIRENYTVGKTFAFGYSMGGRIALELTAEELWDVDRMVLVAPAEDYEDLKNLFGGAENWEVLEAEANENGFVSYTTIYATNELSKEWFADLAKYPDGLAEAALEKFGDKPVMVIYAVDDQAVAPTVSQAVADVFGAEVHTTPFGGHSYSFYNDDPELAEIVNGNTVEFLTRE